MEANEVPEAPASRSVAQPLRTSTTARWFMPAMIALIISASAWTFVYLWVTVPGSFLSSAPTQRFAGAQMTITRGTGYADGTNFIIQATDPSGIAVVTIDTPTVNAADYRRIRWKVHALQADVALAMLWRSNASRGKINSIPLEIYGDLLWSARPAPPDWSGRIEGIALTVQGALNQPIFIEEVTIDPMDARGVVADRIQDWFAFRHWSGLSINTAIGGPLEQPLWLTLAAAIVALSAVALFFFRFRDRMSRSGMSLSIALIVALTWFTLDARWLWLRLQQAQSTAASFAGKSPRDKHLADIDGYVYAFAEQVIARLPKTPVRIFVSADDHYFGGRLAYHLYPHNAYMNHDSGALPPASQMKGGDYIVVFRRHGIRYDPAKQMLTWDEQPAVNADVLIAHQGNAAFRLR